MVAIAIVSWPPVARLVRGEVLSLRTREYVQAAVVTGQTNWWIIWREILPNALSPVIVLASLMVATAILLESSLSFLGLGDPNLMSWGYMVGAGRTVIRQAWWITVFPGIAILVSVLALNLIGEGLNDALNPRLAKGGTLSMTPLPSIKNLKLALPPGRRPPLCRRWRFVRSCRRQDPLRGRRIRLRQVDVRACADGPAAGYGDGRTPARSCSRARNLLTLDDDGWLRAARPPASPWCSRSR